LGIYSITRASEFNAATPCKSFLAVNDGEGAIEKGGGTRVGIIVATSDGGATWAEVHQTTMTLRDIAFPDILHGWAVDGDHHPGHGRRRRHLEAATPMYFRLIRS
jgi:hypothetical protein